MASPPPPHGVDTQSPSLRDRKEPPPVKHIIKLGKKGGPGSGGGKKAEQSMEESLIVSGPSSCVLEPVFVLHSGVSCDLSRDLSHFCVCL